MTMNATEGPVITDRRAVATGKVAWTITEFDHGHSMMLIADGSQVHFHAHFTAEQWAAFREMVMLREHGRSHSSWRWFSASAVAV